VDAGGDAVVERGGHGLVVGDWAIDLIRLQDGSKSNENPKERRATRLKLK